MKANRSWGVVVVALLALAAPVMTACGDDEKKTTDADAADTAEAAGDTRQDQAQDPDVTPDTAADPDAGQEAEPSPDAVADEVAETTPDAEAEAEAVTDAVAEGELDVAAEATDAAGDADGEEAAFVCGATGGGSASCSAVSTCSAACGASWTCIEGCRATLCTAHVSLYCAMEQCIWDHCWTGICYPDPSSTACQTCVGTTCVGDAGACMAATTCS